VPFGRRKAKGKTQNKESDKGGKDPGQQSKGEFVQATSRKELSGERETAGRLGFKETRGTRTLYKGKKVYGGRMAGAHCGINFRKGKYSKRGEKKDWPAVQAILISLQKGGGVG